MLSRKQIGLVALVIAIVVAIIVGAVVGTQRAQSNDVTGGATESASLEKCSSEPCTADPKACRSKFGFCGIGDAWCNSDSTWRPEGCTSTVPVGGSNCTGQPCTDLMLCRSQWGYCGSGSAYWVAAQPTSTLQPTSAGTQPTNSPIPASSLCSGEACPSSGQCRSEWGFCGTSPAYCNAKSTYSPSCPGAATNNPTLPQATKSPTVQATAPPTFAPTSSSPTALGVTNQPTTKAPTSKAPTTLAPTQATRTPTAPTQPAPSGSLLAIVNARKEQISNVLLQYQTPTNAYEASKVYKADDLEKGVRTAINGIAGMNFISDGVKGKLNLAAFIAQSMKETIKYDVCDENNWDLVGGVYPASNACGQLGQQYTQYHCGEGEKHMECPIDLTMEKKAATNAKWYGAPAPLFCAPKSKVPLSPGWNYGAECNQPWASPPKLCTEYDGQKAGAFDYSKPYPNMAGRTDVEGCCWWGRGVIQLTGPCNVGKLNYFLGKGAVDRGVANAPFPDVDFCREPDAICASQKYPELKWVSGFFYWMRDVQAGDFSGWNYQNELTKLAADPNNANLRRSFINAVSGIVNRGSPNAGNVDGGAERAENFEKAWAVFGPEVLAISEGGTGIVQFSTQSDDGAAAGTVAGAVVGSLAVVGLLVAGSVFYRRRKTATRTRQERQSASVVVAGEDGKTPSMRLAAANPSFNVV